MKKLLMLTALAALVAPVCFSNVSVAFADEDTNTSSSSDSSSSENVTKYTITYHYQMKSWKDNALGVELLGDEIETVNSGEKATEYNKYYDANDETKNKAKFWYGSYKFLGWYTDTSYNETFKFSKEITANHDVYAKWELTDENAFITTLKSGETKAQLYYKYTVSDGSYEISNIGLRFGGFVDTMSFYKLAQGAYTDGDYAAYKSLITSYGISYSTVDPNTKGYSSFNKALESDAYGNDVKNESISVGSDGYFKNITLAPNTKSPMPVAYDNSTYMFNIFLNVGATSIEKTVYAAANLTFTNDKMIYLEERSCSVASLAAEYLADTTASYTADVKNTLTLLSKGQVSGSVNG